MTIFRDRSFFAASLAHFSVDLVNSQRPLLLALLSVPLGLSNAAIGILSLAYSLGGSLSQPLFGWLADRIGTRYVAAGGVLFMSAAFALALKLPGMVGVIILIGTALGSAAFHPAGTSEASRRGRLHLSNLENTATSLFFMFGQSGYFIGPMLGGPLLDRWGPSGLLVFLVLLFPSGVHLALHRQQISVQPIDRQEQAAIGQPIGTPGLNLSSAFVTLITLRAGVQMTIMAFLPKYLSDIGFRPNAYGPIAAMFMGGVAVGNVAGGWLADRFNIRAVIAGSLVSASVPLVLLPVSDSPLILALLSLTAGLLIGASHSIIVVQVQHMMPGKTGVASGLVLGFTFASGSVGTAISGFVADQASFEIVFFSLAIIALLAGTLAFSMKMFRLQPINVPVNLQ
jgi:FSR family fosmidomycin resistance protein-like MFS transporter